MCEGWWMGRGMARHKVKRSESEAGGQSLVRRQGRRLSWGLVDLCSVQGFPLVQYTTPNIIVLSLNILISSNVAFLLKYKAFVQKRMQDFRLPKLPRSLGVQGQLREAIPSTTITRPCFWPQVHDPIPYKTRMSIILFLLCYWWSWYRYQFCFVVSAYVYLNILALPVLIRASTFTFVFPLNYI